MYDSFKPLLGAYEDSFLATFAMGWGITIVAGLASYPIDTVRRRMMMTSGQAVKYKNSLDAFNQIVAKEGIPSLFKGAGANVLRAVAGAGVLSGYDQLQMIVFGKKVRVQAGRGVEVAKGAGGARGSAARTRPRALHTSPPCSSRAAAGKFTSRERRGCDEHFQR